MILREEKGGWSLLLANGRVQLIQIDFRLGLFLSDPPDEAELYIERTFRLKEPNGIVTLEPGKTATLAPALSLFNAKISNVTVRKTGGLKAEFAGEVSIEVGPDDRFEAWQLGSRSAGFMLICSPGGSVSFFQDGR